MISFRDFHFDLLFEKKEIPEEDKVSSNTKGVLHELLVGHFLNDGKHMEKHADIDGLSPEEAHEKLKATISDSAYKRIYARAKAAANDIRKRIGNQITRVQWTSKAGDLKRATGIDASQKEDASDIVATDITGKHHGISLKVSDDSPLVPLSNPGMEATAGGQEHLDNHRKLLLKKYPRLRDKNKDGRKAEMTADPQMSSEVKDTNKNFLQGFAQDMARRLSTYSPDDLVAHIRHHVLHAELTPMQKRGHAHIRHTTYETPNSGYGFTVANPGEDYEHLLQDKENIGVKHSGTSVIFTHKGVPFARHRLKFESGSDPLSSLKGSGEELPYALGSREQMLSTASRGAITKGSPTVRGGAPVSTDTPIAALQAIKKKAPKPPLAR